MPVEAMLVFTPAQREDVMELNPTGPGARVDPIVINNPLSNNLGYGDMVGNSICPARLLNDPAYTAFYDFCDDLPIRVLDSDTLFLPQEPL